MNTRPAQAPFFYRVFEYEHINLERSQNEGDVKGVILDYRIIKLILRSILSGELAKNKRHTDSIASLVRSRGSGLLEVG